MFHVLDLNIYNTQTIQHSSIYKMYFAGRLQVVLSALYLLRTNKSATQIHKQINQSDGKEARERSLSSTNTTNTIRIPNPCYVSVLASHPNSLHPQQIIASRPKYNTAVSVLYYYCYYYY